MFRLAIIGLLVAGCAESQPVNPFIDLCDEAVKDSIATPASYSRVDAADLDGRMVRVEFDAQNRFGAIIRSAAVCQFDGGTGIEAMEIDGEPVDPPDRLRSKKWKPAPLPNFG